MLTKCDFTTPVIKIEKARKIKKQWIETERDGQLIWKLINSKEQKQFSQVNLEGEVDDEMDFD